MRGAICWDSKASRRGLRSSTEPYVLIHANRIREQFDTTWGFAEAGAAGPPNAQGLGNTYGDAAGHSCFAVVGKVGMSLTERAMTLETGKRRPAGEHDGVCQPGAGVSAAATRGLAFEPGWPARGEKELR